MHRPVHLPHPHRCRHLNPVMILLSWLAAHQALDQVVCQARNQPELRVYRTPPVRPAMAFRLSRHRLKILPCHQWCPVEAQLVHRATALRMRKTAILLATQARLLLKIQLLCLASLRQVYQARHQRMFLLRNPTIHRQRGLLRNPVINQPRGLLHNLTINQPRGLLRNQVNHPPRDLLQNQAIHPPRN
jgi:hypothetical protein